MIETRHNPTYQCPSCGEHWTSRPISVVVVPKLVLPPCPDCGTTLELAGFLSCLMVEARYDEGIAGHVHQDQGAAYRTAFGEELKDWEISQNGREEESSK